MKHKIEVAENIIPIGPNRPIIWIGALSFESRCYGSIRLLKKNQFSIEKGIILNYKTKIRPLDRGEELREANRKVMEKELSNKFVYCALQPYSYSRFLGALGKIIQENIKENTIFIIDISCLTKIHAIALAYWLVHNTDVPTKVAYSVPDSYGNQASSFWGKGKWYSTLLARMCIDSSESYNSSSAIIIPGHEGDRLRLSLAEIEADEGLILMPISREEKLMGMMNVTIAQNAWLFKEIDSGIRQKTRRIDIDTSNLEGIESHIRTFSLSSKKRHARIIICPFGPKHLDFACTYHALQIYRENIWISYPIPLFYDANYSVGYFKTYWMSFKSI